ncbi:MAG: hypothetical protein ABW141_07300 [Candidatus Thiodiazotropha endolucinida]
MSMAALMGISAALSSESINSTLESQVKPVMSVANEVHQYTPLGLLTDWLSVQTTEADIWKPSDEVKDAIYRELEQRLSLAMEWRMEPSLALLPWRGQAAWDALYAETSDVPDDFVSRHKDRYDGRLPISEDPETVALYREFFESDREVSTDAGETPVSAP